MPYKGRFAPSPTGNLHLGSVATALFAAAAARRAGGTIVLRIEDLDPPRTIPGSERAQRDDLAWLGFRFDEEPDAPGPCAPYRQAERHDLYRAVVEHLAARGLTYYCDCSRAEIARAASAPHAGEEGPRYPGTCRPHGMSSRAFRRPPAIRLAVPMDAQVQVRDAVAGASTSAPWQDAGDFVLQRGDGVFAYQLAVVADDLTMGVTEVVRGADLLSSAARQALLFELLGATPPSFVHVPMLASGEGETLAKRRRTHTVAELRERGAGAGCILTTIARLYGHAVRAADGPAAIDAVAESFDPRRFPPSPVTFFDAELAA